MSPRITVSLDDQAADTLTGRAAETHIRPSALAAGLLATALADPRPAHPETDSPPGDTDDRRAQWLELDRGPAWRAAAWDAALALRVSYTDLADIIRDGWHQDRFTRDGVLALAAWRDQLDSGRHHDPRLELAWLSALREYRRIHEDHRRQPRQRDPPPSRPDGW